VVAAAGLRSDRAGDVGRHEHNGPAGRAADQCGVPVSDIGCALFAVYGILSAYIGRTQTGRGQYVDASLFEAAIAFSIWDISEYWGTGRVPTPLGTANRFSAPYQAVRAKDAYFVLGANSNKLWQTFCEILERPDLLADARFKNDRGSLAQPTHHDRGSGKKPWPSAMLPSGSRSCSRRAFPPGRS
jgi:crotonobetainyl-CoA:carnitine CoA-transferase CaiB-like acyl-CoA transferase